MKLLIVALTSLTLFVSCAHTADCACHDKKASCADCGSADKKSKSGACTDCQGK